MVLVVVTNSDHLRGSRALAAELGARLAGPRSEAIPGFEGLGEGDEPCMRHEIGIC